MGIREARREARRQAIEEAGLELFLSEGYERASVERIASKVGIARGTFYLYYADKHALFEEFCSRLYGPLVSALEASQQRLSQAESSEKQRLLYLQMAFEMTQQLEAVRPLMKLHFREQRSAGPSGDLVARWTARFEDISIAILTDARDRGLIREVDPVTVTMAIVGSAERLIWAHLEGDERLDPDRAALELSNVFFSGIA